VIFEIDDARRLVTITRIAPRDRAYRPSRSRTDCADAVVSALLPMISPRLRTMSVSSARMSGRLDLGEGTMGVAGGMSQKTSTIRRYL